MIFLLALTIFLSTFELSSAAKGQLLWSDEFDSFATFSANWNSEIGGHGWGNNELQYYTNLNARTENGNLIIEARKENVGGNRFTSSRLISKRSFKYGVFEMRAKLPWGRGTWPAFWLLADKRPLNWPSDGEIDIMEHVGYDPNRVHATIHCQKYNHMIGTQIGASTVVNDVFNQYHTYTLDWSSNKIEAFIDGVKMYNFDKPDNSYEAWPFDNSFNIILNLAVGGDWGGAMGVDETIFPALYTIDYVRHYEHVDGPAPIVESVRRVTLRAKVNNRYISAISNPLYANAAAVSNAETFEITKYTDGAVTLKSVHNGKFVSAENYGNDPLMANKDTAQLWEVFYLDSYSDGTVSFKASVNNKYVCAEDYGNLPLKASRDAIDDWEKFYLTYV